jgi:hypothetical protein
LWIKQHQIRCHSLGDTTTIMDPKSTCWLMRHLSYGVGELEHTPIPNVTTEHSRERAKVAGMRTSTRLMQRNRIAVGSDNGQRVSQEGRDVFLSSIEEHYLDLVSVLFAESQREFVGRNVQRVSRRFERLANVATVRGARNVEPIPQPRDSVEPSLGHVGESLCSLGVVGKTSPHCFGSAGLQPRR